jgi:hypothetical protein
MVETTIVPIVTALAPYVLDSLFGEGYQHIPKHVRSVVDINDERIFSPPSIKEMSMYGYGYRYPRARRTIKDYVVSYPEDYARAALFNKGVAASNPWVKFLRKEGYYEKISKLLKDAAEKYRESPYYVFPSAEKQEKMARAEKSLAKRLKAQVEAIKAAEGKLKDVYPSKYARDLPYEQAVIRTIGKLEDKLEDLGEDRVYTERDPDTGEYYLKGTIVKK